MLIMSHAYYVTCLLCHMLIMSHAYYVTSLLCHMLIMSQAYYVTCLLCHMLIMSQAYYVTCLLCHMLIMSHAGIVGLDFILPNNICLGLNGFTCWVRFQPSIVHFLSISLNISWGFVSTDLNL